MAKRKILISWFGSQDKKTMLECVASGDNLSPLFSILTNRKYGPFDELWLLMTPLAEDKDPAHSQEALAALQKFCCAKGIRLHIAETAPKFPVADMSAVYRFTAQALRELKAQIGPHAASYSYNLTSGTGAMYAILLYLSDKPPCAGRPLYTVAPEYAQDRDSNVAEANVPEKLASLKPEEGQPGAMFEEPNRKIFEQIRDKVANTSASVLIQGETGTGKTALAKFIHNLDARRSKKEFININCAAFSADSSALLSQLFGHVEGAYTGALKERPGAFELANGGTLFLDEIGEIPLQQQGMLLKAIAEQKITKLGGSKEIPVDVRIIAATNVDLLQAIREGRFRLDLYYRLAQYTPTLKPVRAYTTRQKERLLDLLLAEINKEYPAEPRELSPDARARLLALPWRGNIRELKFRLGSICLLSDAVVTLEDVDAQLEDAGLFPECGAEERSLAAGGMPPEGASDAGALPGNLKDWLEAWEGYWLRSAYAHHARDVDAARSLGLSTSTFANKKKAFGLDQRNKQTVK